MASSVLQCVIVVIHFISEIEIKPLQHMDYTENNYVIIKLG